MFQPIKTKSFNRRKRNVLYIETQYFNKMRKDNVTMLKIK